MQLCACKFFVLALLTCHRRDTNNESPYGSHIYVYNIIENDHICLWLCKLKYQNALPGLFVDHLSHDLGHDVVYTKNET